MQQRDLLLPGRTTTGNAALGLEASGVSRADAEQEGGNGTLAIGLRRCLHPAQLSGGHASARSIPAHDPTAQGPRRRTLRGARRLDASDLLQAWLAGLWEQERSSVLLVTHDVEEAVFLADRVIVLTPRPGRVAFELDVSLPRPRTRSMIASSQFIRDRATLLQAVGLLGAPPP